MGFAAGTTLNHSSDFSSLYGSKYYIQLEKTTTPLQDEALKISEKDLLIEENTFFSSLLLKYPNLLIAKNKIVFFYPTNIPFYANYFSGYSLKLSREMSIHLIERSSNLYSIKQRKDDWFFSKSRKGKFFTFFLSNLANLVVSFSENFFISDFSNYSNNLKKEFLFFSNQKRNLLNVSQIFYFPYLKKYNFLKKFYFYFYLSKSIINKIENKFKVFSNNFVLKKRLYLKNFLDNKFLNSKAIALYFFLKKFKKLFQKKNFKLFSKKTLRRKFDKFKSEKTLFFNNIFYRPFYFYKLKKSYDKENLFSSLLNQVSDSEEQTLFEEHTNNLRILYFLNSAPLLTALKNNYEDFLEDEEGLLEDYENISKIDVFPSKEVFAKPLTPKIKVKPKVYSLFLGGEKVYKKGKISEFPEYDKEKIFLKNFAQSSFKGLIETDEDKIGIVSLRYKLSNIRKIPNKIKLYLKSEAYRFFFNTIAFRNSSNIVDRRGRNRASRFIKKILGKKPWKYDPNIANLVKNKSFKKTKFRRKKKRLKVNVFDKVKNKSDKIKPFKFKSHAQNFSFKFIKCLEPFSVPVNNRKERFFYSRQLYKHKHEFLQRDIPANSWSNNLFWFSKNFDFNLKNSKYFGYPIFLKMLEIGLDKSLFFNLFEGFSAKSHSPEYLVSKKISESIPQSLPWFAGISFRHLKYKKLFIPILFPSINSFKVQIFVPFFSCFFKLNQKHQILEKIEDSFVALKNRISSVILTNLFGFFSKASSSIFFKTAYPLKNINQTANLFLETFKFIFLNILKNSPLNFDKFYHKEKDIFKKSLKLFSTKIILRHYFSWLNFSDFILSKKLHVSEDSNEYISQKYNESTFLGKQMNCLMSFNHFFKKNKKNKIRKNKFVNKLKAYKKSYLKRFLSQTTRLVKILKRKKIFRTLDGTIKFINKFFLGLKLNEFQGSLVLSKNKKPAYISKSLRKKFKLKRFKHFKFLKRNKLNERKFLFYNNNKKNLFLKFRMKLLKINFRSSPEHYLNSILKKKLKFKSPKTNKKNNFTNFIKLFFFSSKVKNSGAIKKIENKTRIKKTFYKTKKNKFIKKTFNLKSKALAKFFLKKNFNKLKNYYNFSQSFFRKKFLPLNLNKANKSLLKSSFFLRKKSRLKTLNLKFLKLKHIYNGFKIKKISLNERLIQSFLYKRVTKKLCNIFKKDKKNFFNYSLTKKFGDNKYNPDLKSFHLTAIKRLFKKFSFLKNTFLVKILVKKRNFFVNLTKEGSRITLFSSSGGKGGFTGRTQLSRRSANLAGQRLASFFRKKKLGASGGYSEVTLKFWPRAKIKSYESMFSVKQLLKDFMFLKFNKKLKKHLFRKRLNLGKKSAKVSLKLKFLKKKIPSIIRLQRRIKTHPAILSVRNICLNRNKYISGSRDLMAAEINFSAKIRFHSKKLYKKVMMKRKKKIKHLRFRRFKYLKFNKRLNSSYRYRKFLSKTFYTRFRNKIFFGYRSFFRNLIKFSRKNKRFVFRYLKTRFFIKKKSFKNLLSPILKKPNTLKRKRIKRFFFYKKKFKRILRRKRFLIGKARKRFFKRRLIIKLKMKAFKKRSFETRYKKIIFKMKRRGNLIDRSRYRYMGVLMGGMSKFGKRGKLRLMRKFKVGRIKFIYKGFKKSRAFFITRAVRFGVFLRRFKRMEPFYRRVVPFGFSRKPAVRRL